VQDNDERVARVVAGALAVREQVDRESVRRRAADAPFARASFTMVEGLGVVEPA
jgi:hypothetical protein